MIGWVYVVAYSVTVLVILVASRSFQSLESAVQLTIARFCSAMVASTRSLCAPYGGRKSIVGRPVSLPREVAASVISEARPLGPSFVRVWLLVEWLPTSKPEPARSLVVSGCASTLVPSWKKVAVAFADDKLFATLSVVSAGPSS